MIEWLINFLENLSAIIPLHFFVFIGSFLEELIAPIPSPLVMTTAGSILHTQNQSIFYILLISIIGATGKTIASLILYFFGDKIEDILVSKLGQKFKFTHSDTEGVGRHFNNTKRDDIVLFLIRAIPLFPNGPVSIFCGVIKLNIKTYIASTFTGTIVKNLIYIYAGKLSINYLEKFNFSYQVIERIGYILFGIVIVLFLLKRKKKST